MKTLQSYGTSTYNQQIKYWKLFLNISFANLIKSNTCFESKPGNCIDLISTNQPKRFQNTGVMETGISDHHALNFSFSKTSFTKTATNELQYRNYKPLEANSIFTRCSSTNQKKLLYRMEKRIF